MTSIAILLVSSCVSKSHYDQAISQKMSADEEIAGLQTKMRHAEEENRLLNERAANLEQQNQTLRNTNQMLVQKNSGLSNKVLNMKGETLQVQKEVEERSKALEYASQTYEDLVHSLKNEVNEGKVTIQEMKDQLTVAFVERIIFPAGTVELDQAGKKVLDKVAKILKSVKNRRIQIEGHCDDSAVAKNMRSLYPTNWELSARRATSVVRYLQEKGVDPTLMAAVAFSHFHPIADNKTADGRQTNRRIEIVLTPLPTARLPLQKASVEAK